MSHPDESQPNGDRTEASEPHARGQAERHARIDDAAAPRLDAPLPTLSVGPADDAEDEIRHHILERADLLVQQGWSRRDALREAEHRFGDIGRIHSEMRRGSSLPGREPLRSVGTDVRYALRALRRSPGYTAATVMTLALGIGATTAIAAAVYRLLLAPFPFEGGDRMAYVWQHAEQGGMSVTPRVAVAQAWLENAQLLERVELYEPGTFTLTGEGAPEPLSGARISPTLAATLGVRPLLGRYFAAEDARPGREKVVLLDAGIWRRRYGGSSAVLGRRIRLDGESHTIIGVMPARLAAFYEIGDSRDVWLPFVPDPTSDRVSVLVRLRKGVGVDAVETELNANAEGVADPNPLPGEWRYRVLWPDHFVGEETKRALMALFAAVVAVLMIACANVAGLMLARGVGRSHEFAIRAALGAGQGRIVRHLAVESSMIALLGGVLGLFVATWALDLIRALRPEGLSMLDAVALDPHVLAFIAGTSLLTAVLFGTAPTVVTARLNLTEAIKGASGASKGVSSSWLRAIMVGGQVALSLNLLIGALLLIRSVADLGSRDVGFQPEGLLSASVDLPDTRYATPEARGIFFQQLLDDVRRMAAVGSAAITTDVPPQFGIAFGQLHIEDRPGDVSARQAFSAALVHGEFFRTLRVPLIEGRTFEEDEQDDVVIINQSTAHGYWPGESAIGKRLRLSDQAPWQTVIGVAGDIATSGPAGGLDHEQFYRPMTLDWGHQTLVVRVRTGEPLALVAPIRELVARLDPEIPLRNINTVKALMTESIASERFSMVLLTAFAALALALAAIGLYGLLSYSVAKRRREIGVRIALGARPRSVRSMVVRQGLRLMTLGLAIGGVSAFWLVLLIENLLHGVHARDPLAFTAAVTVIAVAALLASYLPATRASTVDPLEALRPE